MVYVRIRDGVLRKGQRIKLMRGGTENEATELGQFRPAPTACDELTNRAGWLLHGPDQGSR